jgi:hypothetical protein
LPDKAMTTADQKLPPEYTETFFAFPVIYQCL